MHLTLERLETLESGEAWWDQGCWWGVGISSLGFMGEEECEKNCQRRDDRDKDWTVKNIIKDNKKEKEKTKPHSITVLSSMLRECSGFRQ